VPGHQQDPLNRVVQDHGHRAAAHPEDVLREPDVVWKLDVGQAHTDVRGDVHQPLAVDPPLERGFLVAHVGVDELGVRTKGAQLLYQGSARVVVPSSDYSASLLLASSTMTSSSLTAMRSASAKGLPETSRSST
jgi:hypothetical protein